MPRDRKKPGTRKPEKRLLVFCEGKKNKSESAYFKALIREYIFPGSKIEVKVIDTEKNTGKELVMLAKAERELENDILWVVYDKDGYTKHAETFDIAKSNNIKIAFSSISFEYWILLHFTYTSKSFSKSDEIIHLLKHQFDFDYSKADTSIYEFTKDNLETAMGNAVQIQVYQKKSHNSQKIYNFNPYTDVNKLILDIENILKLK